MKINSPGLDHYKTYVKSVKAGEGTGAKGKLKAAAENTDKVTISQDAVARAETGRLVSTIAAEVEGAASSERIEELRQAVQSGSYTVSAADVADAILDRLA